MATRIVFQGGNEVIVEEDQSDVGVRLAEILHKGGGYALLTRHGKEISVNPAGVDYFHEAPE
jgi:hypothetical protein